MRKIDFRIMAVFAALVLCALLSVCAHSAESEVMLYSMSEITGDGLESFKLSDGESYLLGDGDTLSVTSGDDVRLVSDSSGADVFAKIENPGESGCYAAIDLPDDTDLSRGSVGVSLYISAEMKEGQTKRQATVSFSFEYGGTTYRSSAPVTVNAPVRYVADTSSLPTGASPSRITVSFSYDESVMSVDCVSLSTPYTDSSYSFASQRLAGLRWFSVLAGSIEQKDDGFAVLPPPESSSYSAGFDTDDTVISIGSMAGNTSGNASSGRIAYCSVSASSGSGTVIAGDTGGNASTVSPVGISGESGSCLFRIVETEGVRSATLTFRSVGDDDLIIDSIGYVTTDEQVTELKNTISTMSVSDGRLHVEGRLSDSAIKDNMGSRLGLYMLTPCWDGESVLIAEASVSSRFSIDVSLADYPRAEAENQFFIALRDRDGNLVRLSEPRFASSPAGKVADGSCFGLYGADPVAVYESRASYIIADIDISRLCSASATSDTNLSRGDYVIGINSEYLSQLDANINFYRAAGISVYARLVNTSPVYSRSTGELLTYDTDGAREVVFRTDSAEAVATYMSVVSFLCERYPNIASVIVSSGLNSRNLTGIDRTDAYSYVRRAAMLLRMTYSAANEKSSGVLVTVPYDCSDGADISPSVFTALLAERLSVIGQITWGTMYTLESPTPTPESSSTIAAAKANGTAAPSYSVFIWSPAASTGVANSYRDLCRACDTAQTKVIFLSVGDIDDEVGHEEYRLLRQTMTDGATFMLDAVTVSPADVSTTGARMLWDFRSAYSTLGWSAGYGIDELRTAPMDLQAESERRVLRCRTSSADGAPAGIVLCTPDQPLSLSASPYIRFTFSCKQNELPYAVFIFGNGNNRAEYTLRGVTYNSDGTYSAVCDISEFTKLYSVEYFGIILYSDTPVVLELSEISALSSTMSDEELYNIGTQSKTAPEERSRVMRIAVAVCAVVFIGFMSLKLVSGLRRRDRENRTANHK